MRDAGVRMMASTIHANNGNSAPLALHNMASSVQITIDKPATTTPPRRPCAARSRPADVPEQADEHEGGRQDGFALHDVEGRREE